MRLLKVIVILLVIAFILSVAAVSVGYFHAGFD